MYKEEGNEWVKKKSIKDVREAFNCYAVAIGHGNKALEASDSTDMAEIYSVQSVLYANRAMCSITLKNFRAAYVDACKSLQFNSGNIKAHYRKCKALLGSKRFEDGLSACDEALTHDNENSEVVAIKRQCQEGIRKKKEEEDRKRLEKESLRTKLAEAWSIGVDRKATFGFPRPSHPLQFEKSIYPTLQAAIMEATSGKEIEITTDCWPVLCLYPQHNQIDVLHSVSAEELLVIVMSQMFSEPGDGNLPPWDTDKEYYLSSLVVYIPIKQNEVALDQSKWADRMCDCLLDGASTRQKKSDACTAESYGWAEVHLGCTVAQILGYHNHVLDGGLLTFTVFVRYTACCIGKCDVCPVMYDSL